MKIRAVAIERVTVFEHIEAELSPGLNVLIGANATGKSHLLELQKIRPRMEKTSARMGGAPC
jgi:predicted ATP-dependent endonuclease of OLD family